MRGAQEADGVPTIAATAVEPRVRGSRLSGFGFAAWVAGGMVAAAVLIALVYDLPLQDPEDLAGPTYVRLPLILLVAFLVDVVPHGVLRWWRERAGLARTLVRVARERWHRSRLLFAATGLVVWYAAYASFRNIKSFVPTVNKGIEDLDLAAADRVLWLGNDPGPVLHGLLGVDWAAHFLSFIYLVWVVLIPMALAVALMSSLRHRRAAVWYVTAAVIDWCLGAVSYLMAPSLGPVYSAPGDFDELPHTWVRQLQETMYADRLEALADPHQAEVVQSIAAFASLHVAMMVTLCLIAWLIGLPRWVQVVGWVFLGLTVLSTVYLGWHFFVDALGGAVVGALAVWIAALGTGNHVAGRPMLVEDRESQPVG